MVGNIGAGIIQAEIWNVSHPMKRQGMTQKRGLTFFLPGFVIGYKAVQMEMHVPAEKIRPPLARDRLVRS